MPRVSDAEIAAARARVDVYARYVKLRRSGAWFIGNCPFHNDKTPSFAVQDGRWVCFAGCGRGDPIDFIERVQHVDFAAAVHDLASGAPLRQSVDKVSTKPADRHEDSAERIAYARRLWDGADAPRLAELYLYSRGIACRTLPAALRGHSRVWCSETHEHRPAVLAAVSDTAGNITAVQAIWCERSLAFDGSTKYVKGARATDLASSKKSFGRLGSGAVRLAPERGAKLGLAEGCETALAAMKLYRGCGPVWSTCGASRLGAVALPESVRAVVIYADSGDAGAEAAARAVAAYRGRGIDASVVFPRFKHGDFLERWETAQ
jgi:hypothetical protein